MSVSIFPMQEMMLICKGCGGERVIPDEELCKIHSTDDFHRFMTGDVLKYACRCGANTCDVRIMPSKEAAEEIKKLEVK